MTNLDFFYIGVLIGTIVIASFILVMSRSKTPPKK